MQTPPPLPAESPEILWFYADADNQPQGPVSLEGLHELAKTGVIQPLTPVIESGGSEWRTFGEIVAPAGGRSNTDLTAGNDSAMSKQEETKTGGGCLCFLVAIPLCASGHALFGVPLVLAGIWLLGNVMRKGTKEKPTTGKSIPASSPTFSTRVGCLLIIGIFVGLFAVIAAIVGITDSFKPQKDRPEKSNATPQPASQPAFQREKTSESYQIGHLFTLGEFTYRIVRMQREKAIGTSIYDVTQASPNASFIIIYFTIRNDSSETKVVLSDDFRLVDYKGRKFQPSSTATTRIAMSTGNDWILRELQPGIDKAAATAFEVPDDAINSDLTLIVPKKGWGNKSVKVRLGNNYY